MSTTTELLSAHKPAIEVEKIQKKETEEKKPEKVEKKVHKKDYRR